MKRLLLLCLVLLPFVLKAHLGVTTLPGQEKLPVANVHRAIQDAEGYLWYATMGGGLCRDDGYDIRVFRQSQQHPNLIASNQITALAEGPHKTIWFGTTLGAYFLQKEDYNIHSIKETNQQPITAILRTRSGEMIITTNNQVLRCKPDGHVVARISLPSNSQVSDLCMLMDGTLVISTWQAQLFAVDLSLSRLISLKWPYRHPASRLLPDTDGRSLWIGTWGMGIVRWSGDFQRESATYTIADGDRLALQILGMVRDEARNTLWTVCMNDIYAYKITPQGLRPSRLSVSMPKGRKILDAPLLDRHGNVLVPGFSPHTFFIHPVNKPILRDSVAKMAQHSGFKVIAERIAQTKDGYYWLWQGRANLTLYSPQSGNIAFSSLQAFPSPRQFSSLLAASTTGDVVWTAANDTVFLLNHKGMDISYRAVCHTGKEITALKVHNHRLWIGTTDELWTYDLRTRQLKIEGKALGRISDLCPLKQGGTAVVSSKGLWRLHNGKGVMEMRKSDLVAVTQTPDGLLWTADKQGNVWRIDLRKDDTRVVIHPQASTNGDIIKTIRADRSGHLWILSDQYLKEINPRNGFHRILRNTDAGIGMDYFLFLDIKQDNQAVIGGVGAFCHIPSSDELDTHQPLWAPVVSSLVLDGRHTWTTSGQPVVIPAGVQTAVATVSNFDFLQCENTRYAYRLDAKDGWTELQKGDNRIVSNNLRSGHYDLEIKAMGHLGVWSPTTVVPLRVHGYWYASWWFLTMLFIMLAGVYTLLLIRYRRNIDKLRKKFTPAKIRGIFRLKEEEERLRNLQLRQEEANRQFLTKAKARVMEHLSHSDYGVEQLSRDLVMTRQRLYLKMQEATGQKPVDYIRNIRLEIAAEQLSTTSKTIEEVSLETGFSSRRYFTKCFKERFGVLPSDIRPKGKEELISKDNDSPSTASPYPASPSRTTGPSVGERTDR